MKKKNHCTACFSGEYPIAMKGKNDKEKQMKQKVDEILDKLNDTGWESLTEQEENYLNRASKKLFGDRPPN